MTQEASVWATAMQSEQIDIDAALAAALAAGSPPTARRQHVLLQLDAQLAAQLAAEESEEHPLLLDDRLDHDPYRAALDPRAAPVVGDTYEELLALDDTVVKIGLTAEQRSQLSTVQVLQPGDRLLSDQCTVCLGAYEPGEEIRRLECLCVFHTSCIDPHLAHSKMCPVCRRELLS